MPNARSQLMSGSSNAQDALSQGLWALVSSSIEDERDLSLRGTVVLHDGRLLGSHEHRAYAGAYEIQDRVMIARFESWLWHPLSRSPSIFGVQPDRVDTICLRVAIDPMFMSGEMTSKWAPGTRLAAGLMRICDADGAY